MIFDILQNTVDQKAVRVKKYLVTAPLKYIGIVCRSSAKRTCETWPDRKSNLPKKQELLSAYQCPNIDLMLLFGRYFERILFSALCFPAADEYFLLFLAGRIKRFQKRLTKGRWNNTIQFTSLRCVGVGTKDMFVYIFTEASPRLHIKPSTRYTARF